MQESAVLHAGHACTFVPADATLIANSTQPLCKRCLFSFQGPKRSLCNYANENASSYTNLRQCIIKCVGLQVILQEEHLLLSPTGNKCKLLFYGQLSLSGQLASWFRKVLNWYVYNSYLNNNIWLNVIDIWKGLLAKQKH